MASTALPHCRWTPAWLNDRINSRRPWTHEPKALEYDEILQHHPPGELNMFKHRCHGSTYHEVSGDSTEARGMWASAG